MRFLVISILPAVESAQIISVWNSGAKLVCSLKVSATLSFCNKYKCIFWKESITPHRCDEKLLGCLR